MGTYAEQLADLTLIKELKQSADRDDVLTTDVEKLVALVNATADIAGPLLERIPLTFKQYTDHNINHCRNIIYLMGRIIPEETLKCLNGLELAVLLLSALLHDFGMFVTDEEKTLALKSEGFESFSAAYHDKATAVKAARNSGDHERAEVIEDGLLAEFFRRVHPERARVNVRKNLEGKLIFREIDISSYVLDVCESHGWGVYDSNDPRHPEKAVYRLPTSRPIYNVPLNLQYLACCLRLADIMDFDRSRTPFVVFQNINFTEPKSWQEWNKHLQVKGWRIDEREVMFRTECTQPAFYVGVMEFLDWVDKELTESRRLIVKEAPKEIAERYTLHLPVVVDRSQIEMADKRYLAGAFRFQLEYERIMKLLMDKSLYPDASLFLRELLQNSIDACRNREAHAEEAGQSGSYQPRITVWDYSNDRDRPRIIFQDNGTGMSRKIVEDYFMRVGRSYYRSPEFDAERQRLKSKGIELDAISQFGIGILSCFMAADRFEVETYRVGNRPLHITIEGPTKYFIIKLLDEPPRKDFETRPASDSDDGPPSHPGTRITIHLRPEIKLDVFQTLALFAANVDYEITIHALDGTEHRTLPARRWEIEDAQESTIEQSLEHTDLEAFQGWQPHAPLLPPVRELSPGSAAPNLKKILSQSRVPFQKYSFSKHLRGGAWFWFLRGEDGKPTPRRGYLEISGESLLFRGLPELLRYVAVGCTLRLGSQEWHSFLQILRSMQQEPALTSENAGDIYRAFGEGGGHNPYQLSKGWHFGELWRDLSVEDRQVACVSLEALTEDATLWFQDLDVVNELLVGTHAWARRSIRFDYSLRIANTPESIALHGILLPAGFIQWDSMLGESKKLKLLPDIAAGMQVDWRGSKSPTPASNRLFVLSTEGKHAAEPLIKACLLHAVELTSAAPRNGGWRYWLGTFMHSLRDAYFWPELVQVEYDALENCLGYLVREKGAFCYMSREELLKTSGRYVPFAKTYTQNDGLWAFDGGTKLLTTLRPRRKRDDGVWELDIESRVPIHDDTLHEVFLKIEQDILYP